MAVSAERVASEPSVNVLSSGCRCHEDACASAPSLVKHAKTFIKSVPAGLDPREGCHGNEVGSGWGWVSDPGLS